MLETGIYRVQGLGVWGFRVWVCFRIMLCKLKPLIAQTRNITKPRAQNHKQIKARTPNPKTPKPTLNPSPKPRKHDPA